MIKYSIETLYHFHCEVCTKWWSIGDHQIDPYHPLEMTCPHCGTISLVCGEVLSNEHS